MLFLEIGYVYEGRKKAYGYRDKLKLIYIEVSKDFLINPNEWILIEE